jgi:nitroreductase
MEFLRAVGDRRSIRWFRPWEPVEPASIQRILEAARWCGCPGNLQPWRAVVVVQRDMDPADRERLLDAGNRQRPHEQAPVWIYWFADVAAIAPQAFLSQIALGLEVGMLSEGAGWSVEAATHAIEEGVPAPAGMAPLHETVHGVPPHIAAALAMQEANGAITVATLAAVNEGLGTCLHIPAMPSRAGVLSEILGVPETFLPVWLQLIGHPAESRQAGGQRPRQPFEALFALGRWGTPMPQDEGVLDDLRREGLIQAPAPLAGRGEENSHLARMFGYEAVPGAAARARS